MTLGKFLGKEDDEGKRHKQSAEVMKKHFVCVGGGWGGLGSLSVHGKDIIPGTSLVVRWLRLCLLQRTQVQSLVRNLRSHMLRAALFAVEETLEPFTREPHTRSVRELEEIKEETSQEEG